MAKLWNFVLFQMGWCACVLGAAHGQVLWAVMGTLAYIALHVWRSPAPKAEMSLLVKTLIFGVIADTFIMRLGLIDFRDSWPSPFLSPVWMWTLWLLVATTINGSLSWLRGRLILGAVLGAICGPLSYEAGIRLGAGAWGSGGPFAGFILLALVWGIAIPLLFYWDRTPLERGLIANP